ncbi:Zinc finger protein 16-like [Homarus americanus]|nr:Zinc finger protein 16-like [Homarus americanus]
MDFRNSLEMFASCDGFPGDGVPSPKGISVSLNNLESEPLHTGGKHLSLQESFGFPVLFSGRSYVRKINSKAINVDVHKMKSFHDVKADKQANYLSMKPSNSDLSKSNSELELFSFSSETKVYPEIRDVKAPLSVSKVKDDTKINCYEEKELQNDALKNLIKNIESYYQDNETASSKTTTTKRIKSNESSSSSFVEKEIVHNGVRNIASNNDNETVWYECQRCYLEFCTPKGLANHVKTHPKVMVGKNACVYCGKSFDNASDLNDHQNAEHLFDIINYTCESCQVECISADLFDKHQFACHRKQDTSCLFCSNCDKVYYDQDMHNYHKEQVKHCHICSISYCMSSNQFKVHKEKHILFKYKCMKCGASFITKASLTKHLETKKSCFQMLSNKDDNCVVNPVEFDHGKVDECDLGLEEIESAIENGVIEEGNTLSSKKEKTHKCPLCPAKFALVKNMWRHVAVVHPSDLQSESLHHLPVLGGHQCTICEKKVTKKSNLVAHMASHIRRTYSQNNGEPKCSICHKTFRLQRYLVDHMRLHTGRGTHQCRHCDKKFLRRPHLKLHMQMHDSFQKFHSCPHCDKTYMRKRDQLHHIRVKHGTTVGVDPNIETG